MTFPVERAAAALIFLYPVLLLTVRGGANACFFVLIVLAFIEIVRSGRDFFAGVWDNTTLAYGVAMASLTIATLISQFSHMNFGFGPYDGTSRFLLAVPIYLMLRRFPPMSLTLVQYGLAAGALASVLVALVSPHYFGNRLGTYFLNVIHFGDLAAILGLISVLTINWTRIDPPVVVALKIGAFLAGLYMAIQSGSRGGWLAIPIVCFVWASLARKGAARLVVSTLALVLATLALYALVAPVHERIDELASDYMVFDHMKDTPTGLRLQIWDAALHAFAENPVFGIGPDQFKAMAPTLSAAGYLTSKAAVFAGAEVHNEILSCAVTLGVFGLVSILSIYFVPLVLFLRTARSPDRIERTASALGVCFVIAYFVFGLSVDIFNLKTTATFYSLTVAVLLAIATNCAPGRRKNCLSPADDTGSGRSAACF